MDLRKIGRAHLMVRLPSHRAQIAEFNDPALVEVQDYGAAVVERDEYRAAGSQQSLIDVYDDMCQALEEVAIKLIEGGHPQRP